LAQGNPSISWQKHPSLLHHRKKLDRLEAALLKVDPEAPLEQRWEGEKLVERCGMDVRCSGKELRENCMMLQGVSGRQESLELKVDSGGFWETGKPCSKWIPRPPSRSARMREAGQELQDG
jgi:hypothetical protein